VGCHKPIDGWKSKTLTKNGKRGITFDPKDAMRDFPISVPCGQCIGCRLEKSRQWAMRMVNEASQHEDNCFITLTYDEEHLPLDCGLDKTHFQKFMKRLRKEYSDTKVRYYHCGEYGDKHGRPHYHACLFGLDFEDKEKIPSENNLFHSPQLERIWGMGQTTVGPVTFETAAYVARYVVKKLTGDQAKEYEVLDPIDGQVYDVQKEYATMSLKPGIGSTWWDKYKKDCYPSDFLIYRGTKCKPPKYYETKLEEENETLYKQIKFSRAKEAKENWQNSTSGRLAARNKIAEKKYSLYGKREKA